MDAKVGRSLVDSRKRHRSEVADHERRRPVRVLHPVLDLPDVAHGGGEGHHQHSLGAVNHRLFPHLQGNIASCSKPDGGSGS